MKAHKIEVIVIDHEGFGVEEFKAIIEQHSHISGFVLSDETVEIGKWYDDHPLNFHDTKKQTAEKLFASTQ